MSKGYNKDGVYIDTGYLRDHVSKLQREKKLAQSLYENVLAMKNQSDPTVAYQYDPILRDVERLIEYFSKMARLLSIVDDEVVALSHELGMIVEDSTAHLHHKTSSTFML